MTRKCLRFGNENPHCSQNAIILDPAILKKRGKNITLCDALKEEGVSENDIITLCPGCNLTKYELPSYSAIALSMKGATKLACGKAKILEAKLCDKQQ